MAHDVARPRYTAPVMRCGFRSILRQLSLVAAASTVALLSGCVDRTITINSDPPGALVWLNDQEIGRTPVTVDFLHYGTYDVRLALDGYEPLMTSGHAATPLWDAPGFDLLAEAWPGGVESKVVWNYTLEPTPENIDDLTDRARTFRSEHGFGVPEAPEEAESTPDSEPETASDE